MSKKPKNLEAEQARLVQMEAVQMMLFAMDILDERVAGYQMEINGVIESLIVRRVSQPEFDMFAKAEMRSREERA